MGQAGSGILLIPWCEKDGNNRSKLLQHHRMSGESERPADPLLVLPFIVVPPGFGGGRSHHEIDRAGQDHHRLPLAVDVPLRPCFLVLLRELLVDVVELLIP